MWTALEDVWFHLKLQSRPLLLCPTVCFRNPNKLSFTTYIRRTRCCVSCPSSSLHRLTAGPVEGEIASEYSELQDPALATCCKQRAKNTVFFLFL